MYSAWSGRQRSDLLPWKMLSHAEAKPQSPPMLLPAQASPCYTEDPGNHLGHFAGILAHAFLPLVWAKAGSSLQCLPFDPFPRAPVVYVSAQRGRRARWQRLFHLRGTIPFNTKCSVGKPHGSSFFLIKKLLIFGSLKKIQLAHGCIIRQRLEECIKQGIMGYVLKKKRPIFRPTTSGPHSLKYKLLNTWPFAEKVYGSLPNLCSASFRIKLCGQLGTNTCFSWRPALQHSFPFRFYRSWPVDLSTQLLSHIIPK